MARIPLRTYNHEVENLIDRGQIEEAIAHCKNILKQFPKHIETYRLLGKSFLESQRYAEAADILQRVLSVFPDDFVSQLGMSIIREDEGNLDAAIWHMERAYEVQPFNRPVQDELRRLYGRRDGAEPPRIRLTRGALVRMYARGDLYPQAIAEIRAAQAEDPSRIDLIVLLAKMYYLSGQKIEATEISSSLITKLPYCYEANRILMEVLPETSRADDARIFQQRLFSLDPYAAFISPNAPTSNQVPEQTVMVEKVDWQPSMADAQAPDWAKTIGVEWDESFEENLPDWLSAIQPGQAEVADIPAAPEMFDEQPSAEVQSSDELIPEFLKEAGWEPSDGSAEEQPLALNELEPAEEEGEIVEAEIPDWLQSLAPDTTSAGDTGETKDEEDQLGWLEGILPAAAAVGAGAVIADELTQPEETQFGEDEVAQLPEAAKGEIQESADQAEWVQELPAETTDQSLELAADAEETGDVPDWLTGLTAESTQETVVDEDIQAAGLPAVDSEDIPDWIKQDQPETPVSELAIDSLEPTTEGTEEAETAPDWLAELSADTPQETATGEDLVPGEIPDWLKPEESVETVSEISAVSMETPADETATEEGAVPDWLAELSTDTAHESTVIDEFAVNATDEVPNWTTQVQAEEPVTEFSADTQEVTAETTAEEGAVPDWLAELKQETAGETSAVSEVDLANVAQDTLEVPAQEVETWEPEQILSEQPAIDSQEALGPSPDSMDMDAAMAWMEALAARQGADAESLQISQPDERSETPPEWLQQEATRTEGMLSEAVTDESQLVEDAPETIEETIQPAEQVEEALASDIEEPVGSLEVDETITAPEGDIDSALAWMEALAARQGADEESLKISEPDQRSETPPDWITQLEETTRETSSETVPDFVSEVEETAQVVDETQGQEEAVAEISAVDVEIPTEELPGGEITATLEEIEKPVEEITGEAAVDIGEMNPDEAFAWLESLAAKQGAEEGTLVTAPDERPETPPEWVSETIQEPALEESNLVPAVAEELPEATAVQEEAAALELPSEDLTPLVTELSVPSEETVEPEVQLTELTSQPADSTEKAEADIPEWLRSYEEEQRSQEPVWKPDETFTPEAVAEEELPDWLIEETPAAPAADISPAQPDLTEQAAEEVPATEGGKDMPEWLKELQESQPAQETASTNPPDSTWVQEYTPEPSALAGESAHLAPPESDALALAQATLRSGDIESAAEQYTQMINTGHNLDMIVHDLKNALDQYPVDISLWQALGDAFIRSDRVQEALDAYTKAEELLR